MARKYPEGFYVYLHIRESDGLVFYVGKGSGRRAWLINGKGRVNNFWRNTKDKHGITIEIYKEGMAEDCALTLEKIMIAKYRSLGHPLTNLTDGGEGVVGFGEFQVFSSDGMKFKSVRVAVDWLRENGHQNAYSGYISSAALGKRKTAYGRIWSYDGFPICELPRKLNGRFSSSEKIFSSEGEVFIGKSDAVYFLRQNGYPKACDSAIASCLKGKSHTSYGRAWSLSGFPEKPKYVGRQSAGFINSGKLSIAVETECGLMFDSMKGAATYMREIGHKRANVTCIRNCINGTTEYAYGYKWRKTQ